MTRLLIDVYQRLRAEVAEGQVPGAFKAFIKDDLDLDTPAAHDESENAG